MSVERLPPQNVEAEQSVLGSLLIDRDAIIRIAPFLRAEDFYRESHAQVYRAILDLFEQREPADFITLCDALERRGQLEAVGGPAYITSLINTVPTSIHVEYYAHIVELAALRRRLLDAAGQIARLAYEEDRDIDEVIDRSEALLFDVTERRESKDLVSLKQLMKTYHERIDYLQQHREELVGLPTGFIDLDKLLGGLQRSDLIIVAGRPGTGKSSLGLNIAQNAALKHRAVVAVFTLEMSGDQLVQRMISGETGIDSRRLMVGDIQEMELDRFYKASGDLSEALIFVDDTASPTPLEIRSKCRRLAAEYDLDLVIIDYLQLMSGGMRIENRQQEISYISRSLKGLARELRVPVMALAQLSRAVEARQDKRPILSDLRESGCLAGDSLVYLPDKGTYRRIDELVGQSDFSVLALDTETWKLEPCPVLRAFSTGCKPVYKLTTRLGRRIRATGNHSFLTIGGWRPLEDLQVGMRLALPRQLPGPLRQANTNRDVLPREMWRTVAVPAMQAAGLTTRAMQAALGNAYCGTGLYKQNLSRERAMRLAQVVRSDKLARLASSDVYWDTVVSVEADGEGQVYDLTVSGLHNFVANDVIVHNSIEQDADIVMFIYRDELYDELTDRRNIADIIVAKHRNGPTGQVALRFAKEQTKFMDLIHEI